MILKANAKINMFLNVLKKRADGYHELDMIMQSVDFGDRVCINKTDKGISVDCGDEFVTEHEEDNTAYRAAKAFFCATGTDGGCDVRIEKVIPQMAGLGGGSSDCAAVLYGINRLYDMPLKDDELSMLAKSIGADVPFALVGGCRRAGGIGEILEPVDNNLDCVYLIAKPHAGVSTPAAFRAIDFLPCENPAHAEFCLAAVVAGDIEGFARHTRNSLETPARVLCPEMGEMLDYMKKHSDAAFMTGSGSAVVGVFSDVHEAAETQKLIGSAAVFSRIARGSSFGVEVIEE